jgi:hypothetical protein
MMLQSLLARGKSQWQGLKIKKIFALLLSPCDKIGHHSIEFASRRLLRCALSAESGRKACSDVTNT